MATGSLQGRSVVSFESRLAGETAALIEKYGGHAIAAPSMQEVPLDAHDAVFAFGDRLLAGNVDALICLTGVGIRMMIETLATRLDGDALVRSLQQIPIVSRGPKPVSALRTFGLSADVKVPEPNTWREVLATVDGAAILQPLHGKRIAIQEYGVANPELVDGLRDRGATVEQVSIYRWTLPDDLGPLESAIDRLIADQVDVALFTSRTQVDHVMKLAAGRQLSDQLTKAFGRTFVASIGPVCTEGLRAHGIEPDFEPSRPKLGVMMKEMASHSWTNVARRG